MRDRHDVEWGLEYVHGGSPSARARRARVGYGSALCALTLLCGCSLVNDFGGFKFSQQDGGAAKSGSSNDGGKSGSDAGDGGGTSSGSGKDAGRDAAAPGDAGPTNSAKDAGKTTKDSGTTAPLDAGSDAHVDSGPVSDPICDAANCDVAADCSSKTGKAVCTCHRGYYDLLGNGTQCVDLNECKAGLYMCDADATCVNTPGSYDCVCNPGFVWDASSQHCIDACLVLLSTTCDPTVGICTKPMGDAVCRCPAGYTDVNGDGSVCTADTACMTLGCDPLAQCQNNAGTLSCVCPQGFSGNGLTCSDVDECALSTDDCSPNARCTNTQGGFACTCNDGFTGDGKTCTDVDECSAGTATCSKNATCANTPGSFTCTCKTGFTGDGTTCTDNDECALGTSNCSSNAICTNTDGSFTCSCKSGYSGDGITCMDIDECAAGTSPCKAGEACVNTPGSFTCGCSAGYAKNASGTCVDVNECTTGLSNCSVNANCTNTAGSFTCTCKTGYGGDGVTCADIDECSVGQSNCSANATCTNTAGSFACLCKTGFTGDGVTCTDIDECAMGLSNCHPTRATCTNTPGSFSCACKTGYTGNGVTCSDIDECAINTDTCSSVPDACINTVGGYSCMCPPGFTGTGQGPTGCIDINECSANTDGCDDSPDACVNTPGSFTCKCPTSYVGNGLGQFGCCLSDGSNDQLKPNDGADNDCDGLWDLPVVQTAFPDKGGASSAADVSIQIVPTVIAGGQLQCRSFRRGQAAPVFASCPNPVRNPATSTSAANDGAWRTEIRWSWPDGRLSNVLTYDYYIHQSLHNAPHCPAFAVTDDQIFTAADAYLNASLVGTGLTDPGTFQVGTDTYLANPFVTVGYVPLTYEFFSLRRSTYLNPPTKTLYKADMWSLRKRFVLSSDGRYVLIRRSHVRKRLYEGITVKDCKVANFEVDNSHHALKVAGGYLTTYNRYSCDAIVVNRAGAGVCVNVSGSTISIGPAHNNRYGAAVGYSTSDKFMWAHLLDERGWHSRFPQALYPTAPVNGYRNFSEKCDTAGCISSDVYQLYLPDKSLLHP